MPRRSSSAGRSAAVSVGTGAGGCGRGGVRYEWSGQKAVEAMDEVLLRGFQKLAKAAERYWREQEWTKSRHPHMTGEERDLGYFLVTQGGNHRATLVIGSRAGHAMYEEFGHGGFPGHQPIRNTLDRVAYRASDFIRAAAREVLGPDATPGGGGATEGGGNLLALRAQSQAVGTEAFAERRRRSGAAYRTPQRAKAWMQRDEEGQWAVYRGRGANPRRVGRFEFESQAADKLKSLGVTPPPRSSPMGWSEGQARGMSYEDWWRRSQG